MRKITSETRRRINVIMFTRTVPITVSPLIPPPPGPIITGWTVALFHSRIERKLKGTSITPISEAATALVSHVSRFVLRYIIPETNTTAKARYAVTAIGT